MKNLPLLYLDVKKIESGSLDLIPEFYDLKGVIEDDGIWHDKQDVFLHTLRVLSSLQITLASLDQKTLEFFNQKIGGRTRKNLLEISGLLHDIAKKETFTITNGLTSCPDHWGRGAIKTAEILKRLGFSENEIIFVSNLVKNHMLIHNALWPDPKFKKIPEIKKDLKEDYPGQLLLALADTMGSDLKKLQPKEFRSRLVFYRKEIENLQN